VLQSINTQEKLNISKDEIDWLVDIYKESGFNVNAINLYYFFEGLENKLDDTNVESRNAFIQKLKQSVFYKYFFLKFKQQFSSELENDLGKYIQQMGSDTVIYFGEGFTWEQAKYSDQDDRDKNIFNTDEYIAAVASVVKVAKTNGLSKIFIYPPKDPNYSEKDIGGDPKNARAWRMAPYSDGVYRLYCEQFYDKYDEYTMNKSGKANKPIFLEPKELDLSKDIEQQLLKFGFIKNPFINTQLSQGPNI